MWELGRARALLTQNDPMPLRGLKLKLGELGQEGSWHKRPHLLRVLSTKSGIAQNLKKVLVWARTGRAFALHPAGLGSIPASHMVP